MTPALRRRLALLLVGVAASLVALAVVARVHQAACAEAGGTWLATRRCVAHGAPLPAPARAYPLGVLAGVVTAVVLWRTYAYYRTRGTGA